MKRMSRTLRPSDGGWLPLLRSDVPASFVVFLVALPLCMAIAVASGMPASSGLLTGIVGGLVVGWIAGSPLQVSGPAAGLIVLVAGILTYAADPGHRQAMGLPASPDVGLAPAAVLGVVLFWAGVMQLVAGLCRLATWFRAVSPAVICAMLAGIGVLIVLGQFHVLMDLKPKSSGLANLAALPGAVRGLVAGGGGANGQAAALGVLTIVTVLLWQWALKKRTIIPASLVAVILAAVVAQVGGFQVRYVEVPASAVGQIRWLDGRAFAFSIDPRAMWYVWTAAFGLAAIASAESLLSATAVDQLQNGPRTRYNQELSAQGVGNVICALLGGLPMTGVIVRSGANIDAGARSRLSAVLHGLWILLLIGLFPGILSRIPMASLAGILVVTGFKLISLKALAKLWQNGPGEVLIYAATLLVIVGEDLLLGVVVGVVLSALKLLYTFSRLSLRLEADAPAGRSVLHLVGAATFLRLPQLAAALEAVPASHELHVNLERLDYIDHACLDLFATWAKRHESTGGLLVLDWESLHARFRPEVGRSPKLHSA